MDFHILHQFADRVHRGYKPHTEHRMRPREMHLLMLIDQEPDKPLKFYARHVGVERGSFTYLTEVMEHRGYLVRKEDEQDRRKKSLELTDLGRDIIQEGKAEMEEHLKRVFEPFSPEDMDALKNAMSTIERLLSKLPKPDHHLRLPHRHPERPRGRRPHPHHREPHDE